MIRVRCIGRRTLEVSKIKDTDLYEMKIMLDGGIYPNKQVARLEIPMIQFKKLSAFWGKE